MFRQMALDPTDLCLRLDDQQMLRAWRLRIVWRSLCIQSLQPQIQAVVRAMFPWIAALLSQ
jgi:hypothetical protein